MYVFTVSKVVRTLVRKTFDPTCLQTKTEGKWVRYL